MSDDDDDHDDDAGMLDPDDDVAAAVDKSVQKPAPVNAHRRFGQYEEEGDEDLDDGDVDDANNGDDANDATNGDDNNDATNGDADGAPDEPTAEDDPDYATSAPHLADQTFGRQLHLFRDKVEKDEYVRSHHPTVWLENEETVRELCVVHRDAAGRICDKHHTTDPWLTKYERTRVLGIRVAQLQQDCPSALPPSQTVSLDLQQIAELELSRGLLPFIIGRPIHGGMEFWRLADLPDLAQR